VVRAHGLAPVLVEFFDVHRDRQSLQFLGLDRELVDPLGGSAGGLGRRQSAGPQNGSREVLCEQLNGLVCWCGLEKEWVFRGRTNIVVQYFYAFYLFLF